MGAYLSMLLLTATIGAPQGANREPASTVRVLLPRDAGAVAQSAARVLGRHIEQRSDARVVSDRDAGCTIEFDLNPRIGAEGFRILDGPAGSVRILGGDERGLLYGAGKLLRTSRYEGGFTPGDWRGASQPDGDLRGIYLANHFNNYYEAAPAEDLERYVEDLALWGYNLLSLGFPHWQYDSYEDPACRAMIEHMRRLIRAAKAVGMRVTVGVALNGGFRSTPQELRCTPVPDPLGRHGNFGVNLCPSKPDARAELLRHWSRLLDEFADPPIEFVTFWPYDEGGCGCEQCWPWGARGYIDLGRAVSSLVREKRPGIKVIVSTWTFDTPPDGEWEALSRSLAEGPPWADVIQADSHEDFPRYPLEHGSPGGLPLINFPEISMWGQHPWGGYGANPLPARLQRLWDQTQGRLSGGTPYSEGIYEDMNKAIVSQLYWDPAKPTIETVREYAAFEFSPAIADDVVAMVQVFEANHLREQIGPSAEEAWELAQAADAALSPRARTSWRWRLLYLRALIDREMLRSHGQLRGAVLRDAFRELTDLYYAGDSHSMPIRPPQVEDDGGG